MRPALEVPVERRAVCEQIGDATRYLVRCTSPRDPGIACFIASSGISCVRDAEARATMTVGAPEEFR